MKLVNALSNAIIVIVVSLVGLVGLGFTSRILFEIVRYGWNSF